MEVSRHDDRSRINLREIFEEDREELLDNYRRVAYELNYKDQNRLKEGIVFSGKSSKDIELFQGATIIGTETKEYEGNRLQYIKILNTNSNNNSSSICFIAKIDNNRFHYYKDQQSFQENRKGTLLSSKNNYTSFRHLLNFFSEIDLTEIERNTELSDTSFKNAKEVEYCNDISKFSGYTTEDIKDGEEIILNKGLFCDGTYEKRKSPYLESEKAVVFLKMRSEDGNTNIRIRISPIGSPIDTYHLIYSKNGGDFKIFRNNSRTIGLLYSYQLAMDKAINSTQRHIDIPRQANIIKRPIQESDTTTKEPSKKSFWQKLSKTEKITTVLMTLIAISAISSTVLAFFIPSITEFIVTIIGVSVISSSLAAFAPLLLLIPIIFIAYGFYRKHKDSKIDSADNRVTKHILSRFGLSSGAITVLSLILVNAIFPEALMLAAIVGFSITISSLLAAWLLKKEDIYTPPDVINNTNKDISTSKNNILLVINALSFMSVIAYGLGNIFFVSTILSNPIFLIAGMVIFIATFMYRNWQRNIDFDKKRKNIAESISNLEHRPSEDGATSTEKLKKSYLAYNEYLCKRYDNRIFQIIFSFITASGMTTIALAISFPLGMFMPIALPILGLVMIAFSLVNYSIMTKQCQIARKPLDYLKEGHRTEQITKIERLKIIYATISQVLNMFIAADIIAIILFSTVFSVTIAIPFGLLASLAILLILNIWLKYKEYKRVSESTAGLWTTKPQMKSNQTKFVNNDLIEPRNSLAEINDPQSNIFDMYSPYADLVAKNITVNMLYDKRKRRFLFSTPTLDSFLRDEQGNPVNDHANLNNVDIKIDGRSKNVDLEAPSLAEYNHYKVLHGTLLLVKNDKIFGFMFEDGKYYLYTEPYPRVTNLMERKYNNSYVKSIVLFQNNIKNKLNAERKFTKFMIENMNKLETKEKYRTMYPKVISLYSKFLEDIDEYQENKNTGRYIWDGIDEHLERFRNEFIKQVYAIPEVTEEDREFKEIIKSLADRTFEYFDNYEDNWLKNKGLSIKLSNPTVKQLAPYKLEESRSDPIKDNNGEKYTLALDTKKADIKTIVSQSSLAITELPANKLYPHQFMASHGKKLKELKLNIIKHTAEMNKAEQKIIDIIFSGIIEETSTDSAEYDDKLSIAKSKYAKVKEAYALYCSQMLGYYNSGSLTKEQANEIEESYNQEKLYQEINKDKELGPEFFKLITKTKSYYIDQANLRDQNKILLKEKTPLEIEAVEEDVSVIQAEKIDFAKMPSLKAEEVRVDLILDYVASSNKGIFTRINIAALFIPLLTTGGLFLVGTIINVALLSNPIGWAIISASLLITLTIMASSKIAFQISTTYTNGLEYIDIEHIDQTSFLNRVIRAIFSDYEEYTEDGKPKMQTRTILNIVSFTIFGVGGVTLLGLGIFVFSSLSWVLLPVGIALLVAQIPIAVMKIYVNKRIDDLGFANPQSKFLTLLPVIISTFAAATVIGVSIVATITTIGLFPLAISFAAAFLILTIPLVAQSIHKYFYNAYSSSRRKEDIEKKFKRAVIISSIISAVGATAGFVCLGFGLLSFGFLAIPVALSILFIISCSYLLYKRDKNNAGYEIIPEEAQGFNMEVLTDSFVEAREG